LPLPAPPPEQARSRMAHLATRTAQMASLAALPRTPAGSVGGGADMLRTQPSKAACAVKVAEGDVLAAVESLYRDELRPFGRILILRLAERLGGDAGHAPRIDVAHLRRVCESCRRLRVVADGAQYAALLAGWPERFVDPGSNEDPFPDSMWAEADAFFRGPAADAVYPGGRYACAKAMVDVGIPFLAGRSLGQVCHLVQLAISRRRVLGFHGRSIVPFERSEPAIKERCARERQTTANERPLPVATLEQARLCMQKLLREGGGWLPMPMVKRMFPSRFGVQFSETTLGYTRSVDAFRGPGFGDICSVVRQGDGFVLVSQHSGMTSTAAGSPASTGSAEPSSSTASPRRPGLLDHSPGGARFPVARTFIHFPTHESPVRCMRRATSMCSLGSGGGSSTHAGESDGAPSDTASPTDSRSGASSADLEERRIGGGDSAEECLAVHRLWAEAIPVARTFVHFPAVETSGRPWRPRARSLPQPALG